MSRCGWLVLLLLVAATASQDAAAQQLRLLTVTRTTSFGGPGGGNFEISCPFGSIMTGLRARHGEWIDALAPICSRYVRGVQSTGEIARSRSPEVVAVARLSFVVTRRGVSS